MAASSPDLKAFLLATPFFGGLSDASLDPLVSMRSSAASTPASRWLPKGSRDARCSSFIPANSSCASAAIRSTSLHMGRLEPGDFFGEMTLTEMQNRSATVVADSPTVLYELTARQLYAYYKADIHGYVLVLQNINRELCRRLRRADGRITELQMLRIGE